jgi:hypothetical protein
MDMAHKPGNLACAQARELLSDLIDVRRGELPHPDGSLLAEAGLRPALELHLAACEACRTELAILEDVGGAYADYSVGEAPAQMFENYGRKIRARIAAGNGTAKTISSPFRQRRMAWAAAGLSGLAAASWAIVLMSGTVKVPEPSTYEPIVAMRASRDEAGGAAETGASQRPRNSGPMYVTNPRGLRIPVSNPIEPNSLRQLEQHEARSGYLLFPEPLLGLRLKTTRDVDRVVGEGPIGLMVDQVIPGSPAHMMGLRKNDFIVTLNGLEVKGGGAEEAVKFLSSIKELGAGTEISVDAVRPVQSELLFMKRMHGVLGQYEFAP